MLQGLFRVSQLVLKNLPDNAGDVGSVPDNAGDVGSVPGVEGVPREGNGNPFLYACLEKPMDRGATAHRVAESDMTEVTGNTYR